MSPPGPDAAPTVPVVLVTGAAGYVGAHTAARLLREGRDVVGLDNLSTGLRRRLDRLRVIASEFGRSFIPVEGDIADEPLVAQTLAQHAITEVVHMAASCIVSESVADPGKYHRNNTLGTAALLRALDDSGVRRFVLSSTTAVYGDPDLGLVPIPESTPCDPINPYGASKLECERRLRAHTERCRDVGIPFAAAALRFFNVAGCEPDLGEQTGDAGRLIPACIRVALGEQESLTICGSDFPTPDGTAIRDYVDVRDVADAHVAVLNAIQHGEMAIDNIGSGRGWSVLEIADATARVSGTPIPTIDGPRRPGDPAALVADVSKIERELGWRAAHTDIDEVIGSVWDWARRIQSR